MSTGFRVLRLVLIAVVLSCISPQGEGAVVEERIGELAIRVYAPAWIWQRQNVNVLVVLESAAAKPTEVLLGLRIPPETAQAFDYAGDLTGAVSVSPRAVSRFAFTNIAARSGVALGTFPFAIDMTVDGETLAVPFDVRTIRGAAVSSSQWAALAPPGLAAIWCVVMITVLRRFAAPGAWRTPGDPAS